MLESAEITALVEMSDQDGPMRGKLWGSSIPMLVGLSLHVAARAAGTDDVGWLLGGFHFATPTTPERKAELISFMKEREFERVSPMHCTTRVGIELLERELPKRFCEFGLGDRQGM